MSFPMFFPSATPEATKNDTAKFWGTTQPKKEFASLLILSITRQKKRT